MRLATKVILCGVFGLALGLAAALPMLIPNPALPTKVQIAKLD